MELMARVAGREERVRIEPGADGGRLRVTVGERAYEVDAQWAGGVLSLCVDGRQAELAVTERQRSTGGATYWVGREGRMSEVEVLEPLAFLARAQARERDGSAGAKVHAYMPGRVVQILVAEGESVTAGQGVLVLEAMKMENEIAAESAGTLTRLHVTAGQAVEGGDLLFEIG